MSNFISYEKYEKYKKMKLIELKEICKKRKIKGYSSMKKKKLIEILLEDDRITYRRNKCLKCKKYIHGNLYVRDNDRKYHIKCYNKKNEKKNRPIDCSICLEQIDEKDKIKTDCNHYFHKKCLRTWSDKSMGVSCPNCRGKTRNILSFTDIIQEIILKYKEDRDANKIRSLGLELERLLLNTMNFYFNHIVKEERLDEAPEVVMESLFEKILNLYTINRDLILNK